MDFLISVIIPVYNTEKTLRQCLESVLSQKLNPIEILVVNDASPDHSVEILQEYEGRITVLTHRQNKGLLSARLTGIRAAKGKYILFVDSDDALVPGILQELYEKAEDSQSDITAFGARLISTGTDIPEKQVQKIEKTLMPFPGKLTGKAVYQECFGRGSYRWTMWGKLFRYELCRKHIEEIPDEFCLMAEDFSLYSVFAYYAKSYVSISRKGYLYLYESGISSCSKKISADVLWKRQSPFQALNNVRNFLTRQKVSEETWNAFHRSEQLILLEYFHRWDKCLAPDDRYSLFHKMMFHYDSYAVMSACRKYFASKKEILLENLTGFPPAEEYKEKEIRKTGYVGSSSGTQWVSISVPETEFPERWHVLIDSIKKNELDAVVLDCVPSESLFRDMMAIRAAGAMPILWKKDHASAKMGTCGLSLWLQEDRILRGAAGILTADAVSADWYRSCGRRADVWNHDSDLNELIHQDVAVTESVWQMLQSLEQCDMKYAGYTILPSADGESFVPFYRKLNTLFRKLPDGFRKKLFHFLGKIYDRFAGY